MGWLSSLLKPTPVIEETGEEEAKASIGSEWVGEPVPLVKPAAAGPDAEAAAKTAAGPDGGIPRRPSPPRLRPERGTGVPSALPLEKPGVPKAGEERVKSVIPAPAAPAGAHGDASGQPSPGIWPEQPVPGKRRKKGRMQDMPFLSLDPDYARNIAAPGAFPPEPAAKGNGPAGDAGAVAENAAGPSDEEDIVNLTEADMLDSPLLQPIPALLHGLDSALRYAASALGNEDAWGIANTAARIADRAEAFGLLSLADSARLMEEAARNREFGTAGRLLSELQEEMEQRRRAV
jgi:HPt (histidine-containing phosphotransfer) domain-containing protein